MIIEKQIVDFWQKEFSKLSVKLAAEQMNLSRQAVYNALKGNCTQKTHDTINAYLERRKKSLTKLINT